MHSIRNLSLVSEDRRSGDRFRENDKDSFYVVLRRDEEVSRVPKNSAPSLRVLSWSGSVRLYERRVGTSTDSLVGSRPVGILCAVLDLVVSVFLNNVG